MTDSDDAQAPAIARSKLSLVAHIDDVAAGIASRPARTLVMLTLTALGVASAVGVLGLAQATRIALSDRFLVQRTTMVEARPADDQVADVPADFEERLARVSGVQSAAVLEDLGELGTSTVIGPPLAARVVRADGQVADALELDGAGPAFSQRADAHVDGVLVGSALARQLQLGPVALAPVIQVDGVPARVSGLITSSPHQPALLGSVVVGRDVALVTEPAEITLAIRVSQGTASFVSANVGEALAPQQPEQFVGRAAFDDSALRREVDAEFRDLVLAAAGVVLVGAVLAGGIAASSAVNARRPEIGLRRVLGARPIHIFALVLSETMIAGGLGGLSGGWLGAAVVLGIAPADQPVVDPRLLLAGPLLGVATGALAGLIPAISATRVAPSAAFRFS